MSTETRTAAPVDGASLELTGGALAGLIGSALMGVLMLGAMTPVLETAIPAMYGLGPGLSVGFAIHLFHGAVFGLLFAALLRGTSLGTWAGSQLGATGLGLAYGVLVWLLAAVLLMPVWLGAVGFAGAPAVPNVSTQSLLGHVVFGVATGAAYPFFKD